MTKEELFDKIETWEGEAGESFNDRFTHDNVADNSWAFWLLGKGFNEHANIIIRDILDDKFLVQDVLYEIYPEYEGEHPECKFKHDNHDKNMMLVAEFLVSTPYYLAKITEFFNQEENQYDS